MPKLSLKAEWIAAEHELLIRYLTYENRLKKSATLFTAWFIINKVGIYLHLGSRLSCERFLDYIHGNKNTK